MSSVRIDGAYIGKAKNQNQGFIASSDPYAIDHRLKAERA